LTPELTALLRHEEKLEKALAIGCGHTLAEVMRKVLQGQAQVFENEGAVLVTEIVTTQRGPSLNIWLAAGELEACMALSREAVAAATDYGCISATFTGRRGWGKVDAVGEDGWKPQATVFFKTLGGSHE
jgi:hypothetical protein